MPILLAALGVLKVCVEAHVLQCRMRISIPVTQPVLLTRCLAALQTFIQNVAKELKEHAPHALQSYKVNIQYQQRAIKHSARAGMFFETHK
jgi:hypothetical protein